MCYPKISHLGLAHLIQVTLQDYPVGAQPRTVVTGSLGKEGGSLSTRWLDGSRLTGENSAPDSLSTHASSFRNQHVPPERREYS